ncbi:hypothetical protein KFU94_53865 [Chloroflexi bacterium TSY]|nr:hypothetical protein [Chloroflexi bacterium TSY]
MHHETDPTPYSWDELHDKWRLEQITMEQAVGQLLVWGAQHESWLVALRRELEKMTHSLADLEARVVGLEAKKGG